MQESILSSDLSILVCLCLAVTRVYLEIINFNFGKLSLSKSLFKSNSDSFHRYGLYMSIGYIILFAPTFLIVGN